MKKIYSSKESNWVLTTAELYADFNSLTRAKIFLNKGFNKKIMQILSFSVFAPFSRFFAIKNQRIRHLT
jgi:hypothetical protein